VSGWDSRARAAATVVPGGLVLAADCYWLFGVFSERASGGVAMPNAIAVPLFLVIGIVGVILVAEGMEAGEHAKRAAASDGWFEGDRLRVEGGPRDGIAVPRGQLATAKVVEKERYVRGVWRTMRYVFGQGQAKEPYAELVVDGEDGAAITLAEATTTAERRVLARAAEVLAGRTPPASHVSGRGAARDDAGLASAEPTASKLLDGAAPAGAVRRLQRVAAAMMQIVWPVVAVAPFLLGFRPTIPVVLVAIAIGLAIVGALWLALRPQVLARAGHATLALDLAAIPGTPSRCRVCDAPLTTAGDRRLARCAACGQDNVLGVALETGGSRDPASAVAAIDRYRRDRGWARAGAFLLALSVAGSAFAAVRARTERESPEAIRCREGSVIACSLHATALAKTDVAAAIRFIEPHCDPSDHDRAVHACYTLAQLVTDDPARGEQLFRAACEMGESFACVDHKRLCERAPQPACDPAPVRGSKRGTP
jgi:hypothetical protein